MATLVARGVTPAEVYAAVATELARCLGVYYSALWRYEPDGAATLLAARDDDPGLTKMPVGARFSLEGDSVPAMVLRTGRPARMDSYENAAGSTAARLRDLGLRAAVGAPIVVDGRVWGAAIVGSSRPEPLPPDTEARVADFTDLVATAIANAQAHAELTASRARIVAAADDARRRLERDLHDGAQQRLVSLGLQLRIAEASVPSELQSLREQISDVVDGLVGVSEEVQEISRGIHPAILSKGGLGPALKTLARRSTVPVELDLAVDRRLPESAEVAAYYVVAEALTNAAKHARASQVTVRVEAEDANLHLWIRDDGIGGADVSYGIWTHRSDRPRRSGRGKDGGLESARMRDVTARRDPGRSPVRCGCGKRLTPPKMAQTYVAPADTHRRLPPAGTCDYLPVAKASVRPSGPLAGRIDSPKQHRVHRTGSHLVPALHRRGVHHLP